MFGFSPDIPAPEFRNMGSQVRKHMFADITARRP